MAIYKINDTKSNTSIEFEPKNKGLIEITMLNPDNDFAGGCITIKKIDFKEIAFAVLKNSSKE